jgi:hypothetical protein
MTALSTIAYARRTLGTLSNNGTSGTSSTREKELEVIVRHLCVLVRTLDNELAALEFNSLLSEKDLSILKEFS